MAADEQKPSVDLRRVAQDLFGRIYAFYDVKVLALASELGVFEALDSEPSTPEALAAKLKTGDRGMRSLLLGLKTLGLVHHDGNAYALNEAARAFFLPNAKGNLIGAVSFANWQFDALPRLGDAIKDDAIVWEGFEHYIAGAKGVESEEANRRQALFNEGLAAGATGTAKAVMAKLDFSGVKALLDVGGNVGVFASTILDQFADMRATVFDLPQVAEQVNADTRGLAKKERLDAVGGDFLADALPSGYDMISFIRIFNSRTIETCRALLRKAFDALPSGGRCLFYEEHVLPEDPNDFPPGALWGALFILISSPGELRTLSFWESLYREAGFVEVRGVPGKQSGIVVGTKP